MMTMGKTNLIKKTSRKKITKNQQHFQTNLIKQLNINNNY